MSGAALQQTATVRYCMYGSPGKRVVRMRTVEGDFLLTVLGNYGFVEFATLEDTENALTLDGEQLLNFVARGNF